MNKNQSSKNLRGFLINQVIVNTIFNAALNAAIPYFVLRSYTTVHLYIGEQSFAKNIVPLFFILPLVLTIIMVYQTVKKVKKEGLQLPFAFSVRRFALITGFTNGALSILFAGIIFLIASWQLPDYLQSFPTSAVITASAVSAGVLAAIFTIQPISKLQKITIQ